MSDDEVLNLPGWGRPSRITRVKMARVWREEWTYGQPMTGERHLYFANARLVDIIDKPAVDQVRSSDAVVLSRVEVHNAGGRSSHGTCGNPTESSAIHRYGLGTA